MSAQPMMTGHSHRIASGGSSSMTQYKTEWIEVTVTTTAGRHRHGAPAAGNRQSMATVETSVTVAVVKKYLEQTLRYCYGYSEIFVVSDNSVA
jgi:hypothetical protein